jgi:hypothetical protein
MGRHDEFTRAAERLRLAIWGDRWPLGIALGLVWLACVALLAWQTWLGRG